MAKTLVDEPPPPTLSEPGAQNRPTLDDIPAHNRPTLDDIPGERRGPSPTLVDPPAPAAAALPVAPAPAAPPAAAPPPLAHPAAGGQNPGLLAQLPAMPPNRTPGVPITVPEASPVAPPVAAPAQQASPQQGYSQQASPQQGYSQQASPQQAPPQQASPQQGYPQQASPQQALPQQTLPQQAPPQQASPQQPLAAAPPRVAPGGRTLLGVAPPPPTHAVAPPGASAQSASQPTAQPQAQHTPRGQAGTPDPHGAIGPSTPGLAAGNGASPGPAAAPAGDGAPPGPAGSPSPAPRKSSARTVVAAAVAVLGLLAIVAVVVGYFAFFRYTPLAERHIPAQSNVAFRADVRQIATFAPVRKHLWPLLEGRPSQKTQGKTFADKVADATGINPTIDVRELIVASVDSRSWVALVGGTFDPGTFVSGMEKVFQEEGYPGWQRSGDLLVGPAGIALAQAEDGTLVIGTEAEIVKSALPASEEHRRMSLPTDTALSFAVTKEAWEELSREAGAFDAAGSLRRIRHLRGTLSLGDQPAVDVDIEPKGGENADALGRDVETMLAALRLFLVLAPDRMGEKSALSGAKVTVEEQHVRVRAPWPLEGLDRACADLAARLR